MSERAPIPERELIASRWLQRRKQNAAYLSSLDSSYAYQDIGHAIAEGNIDYENWSEWGKLLQVYDAMGDKPDIDPFLFDSLLDESARKLEGLFMADGNGFNVLRSFFAGEKYRKCWDMFYATMNMRTGNLVLDLARKGFFYDGLNLRGMRMMSIPEFTSCCDADMQDTTIGGYLKNISWEYADLRNAVFSSAHFVYEHRFRGAKLDGTEFRDCEGMSFTAYGLPDAIMMKIKKR